MSDKFIEAILLCKESGYVENVNKWLKDHQLCATPMSTGFLISGTTKQFEAVFSINLNNAELPFMIPVPETIKEYVNSICIPKLRQF